MFRWLTFDCYLWILFVMPLYLSHGSISKLRFDFSFALSFLCGDVSWMFCFVWQLWIMISLWCHFPWLWDAGLSLTSIRFPCTGRARGKSLMWVKLHTSGAMYSLIRDLRMLIVFYNCSCRLPVTLVSISFELIDAFFGVMVIVCFIDWQALLDSQSSSLSCNCDHH